MSVVEQLRGKLAVLNDERKRLELLIEGISKQLCAGLNTLLAPPEDLDVPMLDVQFDQLKEAWGNLKVIESDIARIVKELR